jgi:hypothetical protein
MCESHGGGDAEPGLLQRAPYLACEKFCLAVYTDEHYSGRRKLLFQLAVKEVL